MSNGKAIAPPIVSYPLRRYLLDDARGKARAYEPYYYGVQFPNISALALNTDSVQTVTVDSDAPFLWQGIMAADDGPTDSYPPILLEIRIGGSGGRSISRGRLAYSNIIGYRPCPMMLPAPYLVAPGSEFHVTLRLHVDVNWNEVWVIFTGLKVGGFGP